ncbi:hypothetical protein [Pseudomonas sp. RIT-PI-AD]|uniref:hypothetical protein n=1 Tax=Pseudomonas sp. RIT-PI-AD TaxID=3035294 RepID=UPI0021D988EB|nr:hypothetical protein [Pseudomonas sp. RIT-PI-AD]
MSEKTDRASRAKQAKALAAERLEHLRSATAYRSLHTADGVRASLEMEGSAFAGKPKKQSGIILRGFSTVKATS